MYSPSAEAHAPIKKLCKLFGLSWWKRLQTSQVHLLKGCWQLTEAKMYQQFFSVISLAETELKQCNPKEIVTVSPNIEIICQNTQNNNRYAP